MAAAQPPAVAAGSVHPRDSPGCGLSCLSWSLFGSTGRNLCRAIPRRFRC